MTLQPGTRVGPYEIRSTLGAGGMGEVYLAHDTGELERLVALKFVTAEITSNPERMRRFAQEARTASSLNHPNILTIYEFGEAEGTRFIATEFVDGTTLREHMRTRPKLHEVLDIAVQIAAALEAAHEAGIIHRDIKPENIMIRRRDHIVKVLDFGLAKPREVEAQGVIDTDADTKLLVRTQAGVIMGTVAYMSPEQSQGAAVDARTDLWSLGVVLYEMLAGLVPFTGKDMHRQIIAIQEQERPPLSKYVEGIPERLDEISQKTLAKDVRERYQTARDLLIDLRTLRRKLDGDMELPRPTPLDTEASLTARRVLPSNEGPTRASEVRAAHQSSAEYIISIINARKRTFALGLVIVLIAALALGYRYFTDSTLEPQDVRSLAVLPFQNVSGSPDVEYLSDGMTESLINTLTDLPDLSVKARSSVFRYKGKEIEPKRVATELSVQAILNGRLMQRSDDLVLYLSLVDAESGNQLWGEQYTRKLADLVSLQSEIARDVSAQLRPRLDGAGAEPIKRGTDDPSAYQAYLKGRYYWNKAAGPSFERSREFFQKAIELDPSYALAYAGLSDYYGLSGALGVIGGPENWIRSEAAAKKALALDPELGEAYNGLAGVELLYYRDWLAAERAFRRGVALAPNYAVIHQHYARSLMLVGRNDDAIVEFRRTLELEPFELRFNLNLGRLLFYMRQPDNAIEQLRKTLEIDPDYAAAHEALGDAYEHKGMQREAITEWITALKLSGDGEQASILEKTYAASGFDAALRAAAGRNLEALNARRSSGKYVASVHYVLAYMRLGDKEQAFEWLARAVEERNRFALEFRINPVIDPLRSDPRFDTLIARAGVRME